MAGRLYRMAKVVSANPKSWGIVDANEISGFKRVAKLSDLYSIAECILSSSYGDGVTDGADAVGQIWHVSETNGDYKLTNWADRKSAAGWTKLSYGGDISVPVRDVQVDGTTVLSDGVANINLKSRLDNYATTTITNNLSAKIDKKADNTTVTSLMDSVSGLNTNFTTFKNSKGQANGLAALDEHGYIPLDQLGNLDMTVFTVVESLPTSNIENKVYLVRSSLTSDKNNYIEYIYTGDRKGTYDATKWEKLGEVTASVDLSGYYTKTDADKKIASEINKHRIETIGFVPATDGTSDLQLKLTEYQGEKVGPTTIPTVTTNTNGLMSPTMLGRLNSALTEAPSFELATSGNESLLNIEVTYNKKPYTVSLPNAGEGGVGLMTPDMYAKLEDTSNNLPTLTTKVNDLTENVNGIKSFSVNNVVDGEQYSLMATDGTDAFNVGNIFIRTAGNGNTEIEAGGKKTDINAIAAYARYDINGNHIDATYLKKADLVAISNDELTKILI